MRFRILVFLNYLSLILVYVRLNDFFSFSSILQKIRFPNEIPQVDKFILSVDIIYAAKCLSTLTKIEEYLIQHFKIPSNLAAIIARQTISSPDGTVSKEQFACSIFLGLLPFSAVEVLSSITYAQLFMSFDLNGDGKLSEQGECRQQWKVLIFSLLEHDLT